MFELKLLESDPAEDSENESRVSYHRTVVTAIRVVVYWTLWICLLWVLKA